MDRRKFLEYSAAAVAVGGAALAGYYFGTSGTLPISTEAPRPTTMSRPATARINNPPVVSEIKVKPRYICPTTECTIQLSHDSYDPDGDPLTTTWLVDHKEVSHEREYSTRLPEGAHWIGLRVSDGTEEKGMGARVTVEPDQIYAVRPLHMRYKGTSYYVGNIMPQGPNVFPTEEEMDEQLDTIRDDLDCNAVIITGGDEWEDKIIECSRMAVEKGFDRVYVQPRYVNYTADRTVERIREFAPRVRSLREEYGEIVVFCVGHEFHLETAIIRGSGFFERWENANKGTDWEKVRTVVPKMLKDIISFCSEDYGHPITYAATPPEAYYDLVPWSNPAFESIGVDTYIVTGEGYNMDESWWLSLLPRLKRFRKPILSADWGMMSYKDADACGGSSPLNAHAVGSALEYDEEPQVRYMIRTLDMLNRAKIDGCFWVDYNDAFAEGHGLYNPETRKRKKGFYMYKSYQRTS